jgi:DNA-binding transcriptional LysR family regulator
MRNRLINPDSHDRVQAVIDGQGIALWDELMNSKLESGDLCYLSDIAIEEAGYFLVYVTNLNERSVVIQKFSDWICGQD